MIKILVAGSALVLAVVFFLGLPPVQNKSKIEELAKSPERGKISWHAQMAKAKGERSIALASTMVDYPMPRSLDDALANYYLVVAEPIYSRSYVTTYDIRTWHKFRIVEELSAPPATCIDCVGSIAPPEDLLPLAANEFVSSQLGGEATVEDVRIISSDPAFPMFKTGKSYLLLVAFDSQKIVGVLSTGPWGTFELSSGETLRPVNDELKHPLRQKLSEEFQGSLSNLRLSLKTKK